MTISSSTDLAPKRQIEGDGRGFMFQTVQSIWAQPRFRATRAGLLHQRMACFVTAPFGAYEKIGDDERPATHIGVEAEVIEQIATGLAAFFGDEPL